MSEADIQKAIMALYFRATTVTPVRYYEFCACLGSALWVYPDNAVKRCKWAIRNFNTGKFERISVKP